MIRRVIGVVVVVAVGSLAPRAAYAQSKDDVALSEALFDEGKSLLEAGNVQTACQRFEQSKELTPSVGVTLYLADCLQRLGKTASAWKEFRSAEALAHDKHDKRAEIAEKRAQALAPSLNRITIRVAPALANESLEVRRDGDVVPRDDLGAAVPVDPGDHVVVARSGQISRQFNAHVDDNSPTALILIDQLSPPKPAEPPPPAAVTPPVETPPAEKSTSSGGNGGRLALSLGLLGVGVAAVSVGVGFGLLAKADRDDSNSGPCNSSDQCSPQGLSLRQSAIRDALVSTVGFSVGAAALGACALVTFALPHGSSGTGVVVAPTPVAGGAGALVRTTF